jgi:hypothetical protein
MHWAAISTASPVDRNPIQILVKEEGERGTEFS